MDIPLIMALPQSPSRADGPAAFNALADPFIAALPPFALQMNVAVQWLAAAMATVLDYKDAAATYASNAADAASSAATVGGQAVTAAQAARDAAAASAASAQASAEAAGASANFPNFVDPLDVLMVNQTKTGVKWGKVGQAIGDTLITNRPAPAGYVEAGAVYSQSAYPELFALIGIKEANNDGANWGAYTTTPASSIDYMVSGKDDVIICIANTANNTATGGRAFRSTDGGATWVSIASLLGKESMSLITCDMAGNWIIATQATQNNLYISNDNGLTWIQRPKPYPVAYGITSIASGQPGVFVMVVNNSGNSIYFIRSSDYFATWTAGVTYTSYAPATPLVTDGNGFLMIGLSLGANALALQSYDNFATAIVSGGLTSPRVSGSGFILAATNGSITVISETSLFSTQANGIAAGNMFVDKAGIIYSIAGSTDAINFSMFRSYDRGITWARAALALGTGMGTLPTTTTITLSNGTWIAHYNGVWRKSTRLYTYDTSTQFKVPAIKAPQGFKAYVKAKAA